MKKINEDNFYGLNYINYKEKYEVLKMLNNKSLFRYDGVKMCHESDKVENMMRDYFNQDVLLVNNGTAALKLCLIANNICPGDEVIVPCLSFVATAACCLSVGAIPVFADIDDTFCIKPSSIEQCITSKTKAIIVVHYQGYSCNMKEISEIALKHNLVIIEDVAQAFGGKYNNRLLGTIGDSAAFSFQACKIITCGEGGAFTSKKGFDLGKRYADNGGERIDGLYPTWDKEFISFGENFKITDLQSAILLKQFCKLNRIIENQNKKYQYIINRIEGYYVRPIVDGNQPIFMSLCFIFEDEEKCSNFIKYMNGKGIPFDTKIGNYLPAYNTFKNTNKWLISNKYNVNECLDSLSIIKRSSWLPLNSNLRKNELKYIVRHLREYYEK